MFSDLEKMKEALQKIKYPPKLIVKSVKLHLSKEIKNIPTITNEIYETI